jgi:hypothetical protein
LESPVGQQTSKAKPRAKTSRGKKSGSGKKEALPLITRAEMIAAFGPDAVRRLRRSLMFAGPPRPATPIITYPYPDDYVDPGVATTVYVRTNRTDLQYEVLVFDTDDLVNPVYPANPPDPINPNGHPQFDATIPMNTLVADKDYLIVVRVYSNDPGHTADDHESQIYLTTIP